jgi:hypothetical protein
MRCQNLAEALYSKTNIIVYELDQIHNMLLNHCRFFKWNVTSKHERRQAKSHEHKDRVYGSLRTNPVGLRGAVSHEHANPH